MGEKKKRERILAQRKYVLTRFKEVWCSKFVRDDKNGKTLYTFVGAGAFFGGID